MQTEENFVEVDSKRALWRTENIVKKAEKQVQLQGASKVRTM